jgi:hypothetical protein
MSDPSSVQHAFLFNFSASYSSGGLKRLYEYAKWFNARGGAWFIIHPQCRALLTEFGANRYFVVAQSALQRLSDDFRYLDPIEAQVGRPQLYYSYGIPLPRRVGAVNWFHLSNVLPMGVKGVPQSFTDRLKFGVLGRKIRRGLEYADVISAESRSSLDLIDAPDARRLFVSVNGSDDELQALGATGSAAGAAEPENLASVVGTYRYKALDDAIRVFGMLKQRNPSLQLLIMGNPDWVPAPFRTVPGVIVAGTLERSAVMDRLRRSRFYISTTWVENSYNAASEGAFSAAESYLSDIGPHRELLAGMPFERVSVAGVSRRLLHVRRADLTGANLKTWDTVVVEMMARFREAFSGH